MGQGNRSVRRAATRQSAPQKRPASRCLIPPNRHAPATNSVTEGATLGLLRDERRQNRAERAVAGLKHAGIDRLADDFGAFCRAAGQKGRGLILL